MPQIPVKSVIYEKMQTETSPLRHVYCYITDGCNLRCSHCWMESRTGNAANQPKFLDTTLYRTVVDQACAMGASSVKITGGEPLLHPDIEEIFDYGARAGLSVGVETNGVRCSRELARRIAGCPNPFVAVSLDSDESSVHDGIRGMVGAFDATLKGIGNLVRAGLRPQIIMTVSRHNSERIEPLVRFAEELGAGSVKFNIVQPIAGGERMRAQRETLTVEEFIALGVWVDTELAASTSLQLFFSIPVAFRPLSRLFGSNGDGCDTCAVLSMIGVLADGSYALCGIGTRVPDMVFGHASTDRLEDVWTGSPVLNRLRSHLPDDLEGICSRCMMKKLCLGSCIAQNHYRSGHLFASHWFCAEAEQLGLFPDSRLVPGDFHRCSDSDGTLSERKRGAPGG